MKQYMLFIATTISLIVGQTATARDHDDVAACPEGEKQTYKGCETDLDVLDQTDITQLGPAPRNDPVPNGVMYRGVTKEQWDTIAKIGDPLNCRERVRQFQQITEGTFLTEKDCANDLYCIQDALRDSDVVILGGGTYKIGDVLRVYSKTLMGRDGERVTIDASGANTAVKLDKGTLANVNIQHAKDVGVKFGSSALAYRVVVGNTGVNDPATHGGHGFKQEGYTENCLVSVEAYNGYNESGLSAVQAQGGNADGYSMKHGTNNVTFIDTHAHHNSDDGFDFWKGGGISPSPTIRIFYSSSNYNGKHPSRNNGDGNGFKFGSKNKYQAPRKDKGTRLIYGSAACNNKAHGFDRNGTPRKIIAVGCNSLGNGKKNFQEVSCASVKDPHALKCSMFTERP